MTKKELVQLINGILGVQDINKIVKDDIPAIIEHVKNNFGVRDIAKELSDIGKEKADEIERRINPGSVFKLKPEDIKKITKRISGTFANVIPDELPNEDLEAQLKRIMSQLSKDLEVNEDDESEE